MQVTVNFRVSEVIPERTAALLYDNLIHKAQTSATVNHIYAHKNGQFHSNNWKVSVTDVYRDKSGDHTAFLMEFGRTASGAVLYSATKAYPYTEEDGTTGVVTVQAGVDRPLLLSREVVSENANDLVDEIFCEYSQTLKESGILYDFWE